MLISAGDSALKLDFITVARLYIFKYYSTYDFLGCPSFIL